jgi:hypothetical protein
MNNNFLRVFLRLLAGVLGFIVVYVVGALLITWLGLFGVLLVAIGLSALGALFITKLDASVTVVKDTEKV